MHREPSFSNRGVSHLQRARLPNMFIDGNSRLGREMKSESKLKLTNEEALQARVWTVRETSPRPFPSSLLHSKAESLSRVAHSALSNRDAKTTVSESLKG